MTRITDHSEVMPLGPKIVEVNNVSKTFVLRRDNSLKERIVTLGRSGRAHREKFDALKNITFDVEAGSTIGLIGTNGSGKSTLLKVIGGIIDPTSGSVRRRGRIAALLELGAGFHPDLSGRDNVYLNASILGLSKEETDAEFDSILAFSEIGDFIDTQVKFYSSGMYVRLAFAVAVHTNPDLLLVDEVLAVGDEAFQRKCMDKIRQFQQEGRTIVLVSHSAAQVTEICDRGVVLRAGEIAFVGSATEATKVHREILEEKRKLTLDDPAEEEEPASSKIRSITVRNTEGRVLKNLDGGESVVIEVAVEHSEPTGEWNSSMSIDTPHGQQVYGAGTLRSHTPHPAAPAGVSVIRYEIHELPLAGGQYFVNAEISNGENKQWDIFWQGAMFSVAEDPDQSGTVRARSTITTMAVSPE
ncbi:ABC transporter ATP-binding protein [Amnibacterium flavum]|uniref:ABC transporter ATP-binding protein n=1 Tax=Amnibacterium flavum TaxID=2173173 RepID=A0A2V1HU82_9MICO|nr:ABC transporter ATP-binding protein [Amnibacterium flavum]PVZ95861.1 ABC transporter ATP-binding protein [Amnibacterium flavum]